MIKEEKIKKERQKSKWIQILAIILGVTFSYLVPIVSYLMNDDSGFNASSALISIVVFGGIMILFILVLLRFLCGERIRDLNLKAGSWWKDLLIGFALAPVTLGIFLLTREPIYNLFPAHDDPIIAVFFYQVVHNPKLFYLMLGPGLIIGAAVWEELNRAFLLSRLWKISDHQLWRWFSIIIAAVLNGMVHMYQGTAGMINTGIYGLIVAILYFKSGRILPMMTVHYLHAASQIVALYIMSNVV